MSRHDGQDRRTGDGWEVEVQDDTMIWTFLPGMELAAFRDDAYPVFEELLETHELDGMVTDVQLKDPFTEDVFEVWEQSAQRAAEDGLDRWAVVAEGIKSLSLRSRIDTGDLETLTTERRSEAVDWARE
jgi:hypothetical protein